MIVRFLIDDVIVRFLIDDVTKMRPYKL